MLHTEMGTPVDIWEEELPICLKQSHENSIPWFQKDDENPTRNIPGIDRETGFYKDEWGNIDLSTELFRF